MSGPRQRAAAGERIAADALSAALTRLAGADEAEAAPTRYRTRVDAVEFAFYLLSRAKYLFAAALAGVLLAGCLHVWFLAPVYAATAKLYILGPEDEQLDLAELQIGTQLTLDYREAMGTWEVQERVRARLGVDLSAAELNRMLTFSVPLGTRVLAITAKSDDAELAANLANAYAQAAKEFFLDLLNGPGTEVFSAAIVPGQADGPGLVLQLSLGGAAGLMLALAAIFLRFMLDTSPHSPEDIFRATGLRTLAVVPEDARAREPEALEDADDPAAEEL